MYSLGAGGLWGGAGAGAEGRGKDEEAERGKGGGAILTAAPPPHSRPSSSPSGLCGLPPP